MKLQTVNKIISLFLVSSLIMVLQVGIRANPKSELLGKLKGRTISLYGGSVPSASVTLESGERKWEIATDEVGDYEIEVPPGIYRISAKAKGWIASPRAAFYIEPQTNTMINVVLDVKLEANEGHSCTTIPVDPITHESFSLLHSSGSKLDLLLEFNKRKEYKGIIEYGGGKEITQVGVRISYDKFMVYGNKVRFNKKTFLIEVSGDVIIDDGKKQKRYFAEGAVVNFNLPDPFVKVVKQREQL
ncbi:MAG: carboxypeptidase-like regulatory domain-containing protein [Acidobacteriota bacterium]